MPCEEPNSFSHLVKTNMPNHTSGPGFANAKSMKKTFKAVQGSELKSFFAKNFLQEQQIKKTDGNL